MNNIRSGDGVFYCMLRLFVHASITHNVHDYLVENLIVLHYDGCESYFICA